MSEDILSGKVSIEQGNAVSNAIKVVNGSITNEINAAKVALAARGAMHNFGRIVKMGSMALDEEGVE
jgi:hypothetical protein